MASEKVAFYIGKVVDLGQHIKTHKKGKVSALASNISRFKGTLWKWIKNTVWKIKPTSELYLFFCVNILFKFVFQKYTDWASRSENKQCILNKGKKTLCSRSKSTQVYEVHRMLGTCYKKAKLCFYPKKSIRCFLFIESKYSCMLFDFQKPEAS